MSPETHQDRRAQTVRLANVRQALTAPASAILGYAEILNEDVNGGRADPVAADLGQILDAARTLSNMVDEFLDPDAVTELLEGCGEQAVQRRIRHDLRTPISGIKGYAEMILEELDADASCTLRLDLENILSETNGLLARLDDIVNFSKDGNGAGMPRAGEPIVDSTASEILRSIKPVSEAPGLPEDTGHILVVDDIHANRQLLSRQLSRQGHKVTAVSSGAQALETLARGGFDLVLLDLMMPEMSGYEVLERMKQEEKLRDVPVIMISALDEVDSAVRCIEAGADDYLHKPISPVLLRARIKAGLETKQWLDTERQQKRFIRQAFSRFLAPAVVDQLVSDPSKLDLGGERVRITCLFTDLEGFTSLIESAEPSEVLPLLNAYLDGMCRIVLDHGGTIDKIVGDALHVFFGAPLSQPDHAARAVGCALALDAFAHAFMQADAAATLQFGRTRIGVHTGFAVVGNFGGDAFFDYTAHGDTVNTAARLEGANKHLGTRICVSGDTASECPDHRFRPVGTLLLKGKSEGVEAFEPVGRTATAEGAGKAYFEAYRLLAEGNEAAARRAFEALCRRYPGDTLVAYHARRLSTGEVGTRIVLTEK